MGILRNIAWALFGNDEDGPIGDAIWNPTRADTWLVRIRWWMRNPFHNLMFHVLGFKPVTWMWCWPAQPDSNPGPWNWPAKDPGFLFALYRGARWFNAGFIVSGRTKKYEFYLGWRGGGPVSRDAAVGMTFRKK